MGLCFCAELHAADFVLSTVSLTRSPSQGGLIAQSRGEEFGVSLHQALLSVKMAIATVSIAKEERFHRIIGVGP